MKKNLLFFIMSIIGLNLSGQPTIKIFAFEQDNLPGTKPAGVTDENGKPIQKAATKKNYFIFLSLKKTYNITPEQIFIRGKAYSIQASVIQKTPIEYTNNNIPDNPVKIMLVPQTNNKVIEMKVNQTQVPYKKSTAVQKLTDKNDVVIVYLWNKKKYFITLKNLKKLEPVANQ